MRNDFGREEFSLNRFSRSIWFVSLACGDFRTSICTVPILGFKFSELITTLSCILQDYSLDITRINENLHDQTSECSKINGKRRNHPAPKSVRKSISRIHFFHAGRRFLVAPEVEQTCHWPLGMSFGQLYTSLNFIFEILVSAAGHPIDGGSPFLSIIVPCL